MAAKQNNTRSPSTRPPLFDRKVLWRLFSFLKPKRLQYFGGMLGVALINTAERMFMAYVLKVLVDAITARDMAFLLNNIGLWALFYLAYSLIIPLFLYLYRSAIVHGVAGMREALFTHLQRLPLGYHELRHSGEAMSVLTNDVAAAERAYGQDLLTLLESTLQGLSAAVFMLLLDWKLALLIVLSGLVPLVTNALFARPLRRVGQDIQEKLGTVSERLSDLLAGFQVIRTFSLGEWILARFERANQDTLDNSLKRVRLESNLAGANDFSSLFVFLPYFIGAYWAMTGQTTLGLLVGLIQLNNQIGYFVMSLGGTISRIQAALAATDRVLGVLDSAAEPTRYSAAEPTRYSAAEPERYSTTVSRPSPQDVKNLLAFRDVRFKYADGKEILKGISLDIVQNQVAAFAGPSGGGKSTLFKLLLGCYPVEQGEIRVAGQSINTFERVRLRDMFAYVPQDAYLYSGSVIENIRYGKPGASDEEVFTAARAAYAHDFISALPDGYATVVGERGARLSGGQRQRIAIARALLKDAPILLLDEATSALDSESEELVQQALAVLMQGRTVLVIAHRLSTIESANCIYVIDDGKIVEQGRQEELLQIDGLYRRLYQIQFKPTAVPT